MGSLADLQDLFKTVFDRGFYTQPAPTLPTGHEIHSMFQSLNENSYQYTCQCGAVVIMPAIEFLGGPNPNSAFLAKWKQHIEAPPPLPKPTPEPVNVSSIFYVKAI